MADHYHERGRYDALSGPHSGYWDLYFCTGYGALCGLHKGAEWWGGYQRANADTIANGLPDHKKRLEAVVAIAAAKGLAGEEYMTVEEVIDAYRAWQEEESSEV